jgi:hypothetical protein
MHSTETRNQFLKLRVQGLSFNRIVSQIGVSKPTLIAWSRKRHAEIQSQRASVNLTRDDALKLSFEQEVAHLNIKIKAIRQELLSRSLQTSPPNSSNRS